MSYLVTELTTHTRRVQSLYKRSLRNIQAYCDERHHYRYAATVLRARFEGNRNELDMRKAKELLRLGEEELFNSQHTHPLKFPHSPGGVAYEREPVCPDWVIDYWHPAEKAAYPKYFALREQRKKEFVEFWEKHYGGPNPGKDGH